MAEIRTKWEEAGQGQVFAFWSQLNDEGKQELLNALQDLDPTEVNRTVKKATSGDPANDGPVRCVEPLPSSSQASVLDASATQVEEWRTRGLAEIRDGRVAVLLLAGGQGTRLGSSAPKGCYDVGLPSHKSLFELQANRIAKVAELASCRTGVPWYIMTSGPTRKPTEKFFVEHNYFGLDKANVVFFEQGVLPCVDLDGKVLLETPSRPAMAPDGNGGVYKALSQSGILEDMQKRSIEHVHMYCVDNSLVKVADPTFIGYAADHGVEVATKVVRKRSAGESVGLIVSRDGKPGVIEYSEISEQLREAKDPVDPSLLKLRAANIVNHYYSVEFLQSVARNLDLPLHVARKKIPFADVAHDGATTKPTQPNGIKLEQFVFDVFDRVPLARFGCLEVARADEFSPVKNGPGSGEDCPETARDDLLAEGRRWLLAAGAQSSVPVEIAPAISYGGEGLQAWAGKEVNQNYIHPN